MELILNILINLINNGSPPYWALLGRDPTKVAGQAFQMGPKGPMCPRQSMIRVWGALGLAPPFFGRRPLGNLVEG
jgi:hypothetical protein